MFSRPLARSLYRRQLARNPELFVQFIDVRGIDNMRRHTVASSMFNRFTYVAVISLVYFEDRAAVVTLTG